MMAGGFLVFSGGFGESGVLFVVFRGLLAVKSVASVVSGRYVFDDEKHARF
jgi:hypothetical protein